MRMTTSLRTRWAAIGAVVAITLVGSGGVDLVSATVSSGDRPVLVPIEPCRLADTRPAPDNIGDRSTRLPENATALFTAHGSHGECDIPAAATALLVNATGIGATHPTFLMFHAAGIATPPGSQLNLVPGQPPTPNAVTVDLSASGQFEVFNRFGTVDLIVDGLGYYEHHTHDDRYYTKSQTDGLLAATDASITAATPRASFAGNTLNWTLTATYVEVARLGAIGQAGPIVAASTVRVLLDAAVTVNENGSTGQDSQSRCKFQRALDGGPWVDVGRQHFAEAEGNSNHDEKVNIALTTGFDATPGTHDIRIICAAQLYNGGSPQIESAELTALAIPIS